MPLTPYWVSVTDGYSRQFRTKVHASDPEKAALVAMTKELAKFHAAYPPPRTVEEAMRAYLVAKPPSRALDHLANKDPESSFARRAYRRRLKVKGPAKGDTGAWQLWDDWFEGAHSPAKPLATVHPSKRPWDTNPPNEPLEGRRRGRPPRVSAPAAPARALKGEAVEGRVKMQQQEIQHHELGHHELQQRELQHHE
jgi:hypothetical protein